MSSISLARIPRRVQVLVVVVLLLAVLWVVVLHKVVNSSSSSETGTVAARPKPVAPTVHHPVLPARPSRTLPPRTVKAAPRTQPLPRTSVHKPVAVLPRTPTRVVPVAPRRAVPVGPVKRTQPKPAATTSPAAQAVERELGEGKTVLLLVYDPEGTTDRFDAAELNGVAARMHGTVAVHLLTPAEIAAYAPYTAKALITETPTVLVLAPNAKPSVLTGFVEAPVLEEAVALARQGRQ